MRISGQRFHLTVAAAVLATLAQVTLVAGLTAAEWRKQSIYQVVTDRFARTDLSTTAQCVTSEQVYCGGTWQGLISKLDYIQGMGFTAVWISPIVKQMDGNTKDGSSYHGYWAQDIWSLNSAFGTSADLVALSAALHARSMYLMVDIVTNHMAYNGCRSCVNYGLFNPFSSSSYYHSPCTIDYNNQTSVEVCWQGSDIVSLPDLRTENDDVRRIWNNWITSMVSTYSIDGLRIDSAKHVETSFYAGFRAASGVYSIGEVFNGDPVYLAPYQNYIEGLVDYPSYYWITRAFQSTSGSISSLVSGLQSLKNVAIDLSLYGSFLENHDQARFPSLTSDMALVKNAIAFTMLKDGIPIIYQGQEQHYAGTETPNNREAVWLSGYPTTSELYTWIAKLNQIRTRAIGQDANYLSYSAYVIYSDSHTIAMRKGYTGYQVVGVFTNVGSSSSATVTLSSSSTGFTPSQPLIDIVSCTAFTTDSSGNIAITLTGGLPRVLYPTARLYGSSICPSLVGTATLTLTSTSTSTLTSASTSTSTSTSTTTVTLTSTSKTSTSTSASASASASCTATTVPVTFNALVTTAYGETVKIVGNTSALGSWVAGSAVALSASKYTSSNPLWYGTVNLAPGAVIQYKFIKTTSSGTVTWEADPNHTYTVPCASATVSNTWQG
ncbi:glycoside hydrolase superfamily [Bombardia bombarda]|uniref:alpha-amylase n=1 Tax=Bombardia bombarda TaxID=252184 RepID=A0AA40BYX7_9PEZI|nr:glycoside hydrolase superfamily [Bombardia bombarda]